MNFCLLFFIAFESMSQQYRVVLPTQNLQYGQNNINILQVNYFYQPQRFTQFQYYPNNYIRYNQPIGFNNPYYSMSMQGINYSIYQYRNNGVYNFNGGFNNGDNGL